MYSNIESEYAKKTEIFQLASSNASDPGAYKLGHWRGWANENGVQSAWFQVDCDVFQAQIKIENGSNKLFVRVKYHPKNSWDGINWVEK